jgi:hypothetical protein
MFGESNRISSSSNCASSQPTSTTVIGSRNGRVKYQYLCQLLCHAPSSLFRKLPRRPLSAAPAMAGQDRGKIFFVAMVCRPASPSDLTFLVRPYINLPVTSEPSRPAMFWKSWRSRTPWRSRASRPLSRNISRRRKYAANLCHRAAQCQQVGLPPAFNPRVVATCATMALGAPVRS